MANARRTQRRRRRGAPKQATPRSRVRRSALWLVLAVFGLSTGALLARVAEKTPSLSQDLGAGGPQDGAAAPWYRFKAPPPSMVKAPDPTLLPETSSAPSGESLRAYEEEPLPAEVFVPASPPKPRRIQPPKPTSADRKLAALPPAAIPDHAPLRAPAWQRHARPVVAPDEWPRVAVVIDDMGVDRERSARAIALRAPLTLSFLTYAGELPRQTAAARAAGHELLLHVPMEPRGRGFDAGPNVLATALPADEIRRRLEWGFTRFEGYVGINNHMGSRFTADPPLMTVVIEEVRRRGLLFLDSRTAGDSVGSTLARRMGVPYADRNVFLDNDDDEPAVSARLGEAEEFARRHGYVVAIGHPREATLKALGRWLDRLEARGLALVPLSAVVHLPGNGAVAGDGP